MATAALIGVDQSTSNVLRECFRQFGINTASMPHEDVHRLKREKFEACVLWLDDSAGKVLEIARTSASNSRVVVYGIVSNAEDATRWARYGINVVLDAPVERQAALRVVRATHLLVLHELRRYVRMPVVTTLTIQTDKRKLTTTTLEISAGGMSFHNPGLELSQDLTVTFDLPNRPGITTRARVCWVRLDDGMAGLRFDSTDERRLRVREWIEEYLEL